MPNIASVLKSEISRLARKEVRSELEVLKKASAGYRSDIALLKKRVREMEGALRRTAKSGKPAATSYAEEGAAGFRFKPARLKSHRQKLGLSAKEYGRLVGASGLSIYKWEDGKSAPRQASLTALQSVLGLGKRQALQRLEEFS